MSKITKKTNMCKLYSTGDTFYTRISKTLLETVSICCIIVKHKKNSILDESILFLCLSLYRIIPKQIYTDSVKHTTGRIPWRVPRTLLHIRHNDLFWKIFLNCTPWFNTTEAPGSCVNCRHCVYKSCMFSCFPRFFCARICLDLHYERDVSALTSWESTAQWDGNTVQMYACINNGCSKPPPTAVGHNSCRTCPIRVCRRLVTRVLLKTSTASVYCSAQKSVTVHWERMSR